MYVARLLAVEQPSLHSSCPPCNSSFISLSLFRSSPLPISPPFKYAVGPDFSVSAPSAREGQPLVVRLSAPILTQSFVPTFTGRIEVDVAAEDINDERQSATFGKYCLTNWYINKVLRLQLLNFSFRHEVAISSDNLSTLLHLLHWLPVFSACQHLQ